MPDQAKLDEAWAVFEKALSADEKVTAARAEGNESKERMATKLVDRRLDEAVKLESAAFGGPEALAA